MATANITARLDRTDSGTTWGFRLYGGKDFGVPLTIQRVSEIKLLNDSLTLLLISSYDISEYIFNTSCGYKKLQFSNEIY